MTNIYTSDDLSSVSSEVENDCLQDILQGNVQGLSHTDENFSEVSYGI